MWRCRRFTHNNWLFRLQSTNQQISPWWESGQRGCSKRRLWKATTTSEPPSVETKHVRHVSVPSLGNNCRQGIVDAVSYLACKDPTQANDDQDVEDGRADNRADSNVSFGDKNGWEWATETDGRRGHQTGAFGVWLCLEFRLDKIPIVCRLLSHLQIVFFFYCTQKHIQGKYFETRTGTR